METDAEGNVRRFVEKPKPEDITCDTINAGIYVLEPDDVRPHPAGHRLVDRAQLLPVALIARGETFVSYVSRGYWIDIGTPEKYVTVHRDIMNGLYVAPPFGAACRTEDRRRAGRARRAGRRADGPRLRR